MLINLRKINAFKKFDVRLKCDSEVAKCQVLALLNHVQHLVLDVEHLKTEYFQERRVLINLIKSQQSLKCV